MREQLAAHWCEGGREEGEEGKEREEGEGGGREERGRRERGGRGRREREKMSSHFRLSGLITLQYLFVNFICFLMHCVYQTH